MLPGYPAGKTAMLPRYPTDTVGEFVRAVGEAGFPSPRIPILLRLWLIGRLREFANGIHYYRNPLSETPTMQPKLDLAERLHHPCASASPWGGTGSTAGGPNARTTRPGLVWTRIDRLRGGLDATRLESGTESSQRTVGGVRMKP
jgi:hypothetical protein